MKGLFDKNSKQKKKASAPLADRMRPEDFSQFYGQKDLVGEDSPLRLAIQNDSLSSLIFWGPPGSGKTTLAYIIAKKTKAHFSQFSAVTTGINDVRKAISQAQERTKATGQKTIIFIDEIHRFNKAQQDALLPDVEQGTIILIGATTENPSFEVISPLLSRSSVYVLKPLSGNNLKKIVTKALKDKKRGLGKLNLEMTDDAYKRLINFADGDARVALNGLESIASYLKTKGKKRIDAGEASKVLKKHALRYDKKGEKHYNVISAFIKSMRDSDPSAALYWLARMVEAGEDPKFIARRMIIFASEDVGLADSHALNVANAVARAVEYVGMPDAQINLAHGVTYLAQAPKDNSSYSALLEAIKDAKKGAYGVPLHLRNAVTDFMKKLGYGKGYKYAHSEPDKKPDQKHFPEQIGERDYFNDNDYD